MQKWNSIKPVHIGTVGKGVEMENEKKLLESENKNILSEIRCLQKKLSQNRGRLAVLCELESVIAGRDVYEKILSTRKDLAELGHSRSEINRIIYEMGFRVSSIRKYKAGDYSLYADDVRYSPIIIQGENATYEAMRRLSLDWAIKEPKFRVVKSIYDKKGDGNEKIP